MSAKRMTRVTGKPSSEQGTLRLTVTFEPESLRIVDSPFGVILDLEDAHVVGEPGEPAFPVQHVKLALPAFSDIVKFGVTVAEKTAVTSEPVFVAPVQEPRIALPPITYKRSLAEPVAPAVTRPEFVRARGVTAPHLPMYRAALRMKQPVAQVVSLEHRGVATIATIELRPAKQNRKGIIELATEIRLRIYYESTRNDRDSSFAATRFFKPPRSFGEARRMAALVRTEVLNPDWVVDISQLYPSRAGGYDYLVITESDLVSSFTKLTTWKKRRGLRTRIVTVTDIVNGVYGNFATGTRDLQEILRNFLKWAYTNWGISWVLLGGDANIIPTRLVAGDKRGYIGVDSVNPPEDNRSFWTGTYLRMHVVNPGEWWPGGTPHILVNPSNGTVIPYDANGTSNAAAPGWYYTTDNTYSVRTATRTQFVVVNGPAMLVNTTLQWLYQWNMLATDMYYSSLVGPNYGLPGVHDWDLLDNGLYGQHHGATNFDGINYVADVGLGRAPVSSVAEADAFVENVIAYEQLRQPDGTPLNPDWARRLTLVSTNFYGPTRIPSTAANPPTDNRYHHDAANPYSLIKLADPFDDLRWRLFVVVTTTDIRIIPYNRDAALYGRGWYFAKSATDLRVSEVEITIHGMVFRIPVITPWVAVYGNSDELAPLHFIFDRTEADGSMLDQEAVRKQIAADFPSIDVVNRIYQDEVDLPAADATSPPVQHFTPDRMRDALNLGPHFLSLSGHGSQGGCCSVDSNVAMNARNGFLQPIIYAMSCLTADFGAEDAMSERLLQNPDGGAVAYVGYTRFGWIGVGDDFERAFFNRLKTTRHLALLNDSRLSLTHNWTRLVQILLGDPEMPVWVGKPAAMKVTHPSETHAGENVLVSVKSSSGTPISGAVVCFAADNRWVATGITGSTGRITLNMDPPVLGNLEVVVTAQDHIPYFGSITVKEKLPDVTVRVHGLNNTHWGGRIQFTATVRGTENKEVIWSLAVPRGAGTISQQGLYAAPRKNCRNAAIATSVANPHKSGQMAFTVTKDIL